MKKITVELRDSDELLRMIEAGYDTGVMVRRITDKSIVARRAGELVRYVVAGPALLKKPPKKIDHPSDLAALPWLSVAGSQFGDPRCIVLQSDGVSRGRSTSGPRSS